MNQLLLNCWLSHVTFSNVHILLYMFSETKSNLQLSPRDAGWLLNVVGVICCVRRVRLHDINTAIDRRWHMKHCPHFDVPRLCVGCNLSLPQLSGGAASWWLTDLCTTTFLAGLERVIHSSTWQAHTHTHTDIVTYTRPQMIHLVLHLQMSKSFYVFYSHHVFTFFFIFVTFCKV